MCFKIVVNNRLRISTVKYPKLHIKIENKNYDLGFLILKDMT